MHSLLIVDDEPLTREFLKMNISNIDENWCVSGEAENGQQALELLKNQHVDLIITDIKMPVMDGIELTKQIKLKWPEQEIVILSGYDEFAFAQQAIRYHVHGYLLKPIKIPAVKEILNEIGTIIEKREKETAAFNTLKNLSSDYKSHICRSYLRAIIQNNSTEIESIHPIIYKMKIDMMHGEGIIFILKLNIDSLIVKNLPPKDISVFYYILYQKTTEILEKNYVGVAVLNCNQDTVVYLSSDNQTSIKKNIISIYNDVSDFLKSHTELSVSCFIGSVKTDIFEMYSSYKDAKLTVPLSLLYSDKKFFYKEDLTDDAKHKIDVIEKSANAVVSALVTSNRENLNISLSSFIDNIDKISKKNFIRFTLYLIENIKVYSNKISAESLKRFLNSAQNFITEQSSENMPKEECLKFLYAAITVLWGIENSSSKIQPTKKLVDDAKEYVYSHFSEPITLSQVAETLNVSSNYLSKVFHDVVGESYIKFITRVRMHYAAKLIKECPNEHIFQIAQETGYFNLKHFNFVFKEFYNMTPTEYQAKN